MGREQEVAIRNWLIPAIALLAINLAGLGVGWSLNEWKGGDQAPVRSEQPAAAAETGPTQAELDAQRCVAATEAYGAIQAGLIAYRGQAEVLEDLIKRYCD